jgi:hypothetical protein
VKVTAHYLARKALIQITEQRVLEAAITVPSESPEQTDLAAEKSFELPVVLLGKLAAPISEETNWSNVSEEFSMNINPSMFPFFRSICYLPGG